MVNLFMNFAIFTYLKTELTKVGDVDCVKSKWASPRENLSSGCLTKRVSNQSPQLQRLARKLKFHLKQVYI